ncbi:hypothetical protein [Streptomyces mobaraensis]|uniref:Uncharacterized protein n=1 Tax=Streptomyces mobaraensis TaxID=35621 RepID=A0A5N5WEG6_STRMB|nr:hypothetical protein [Streptomyces mobaraensis]KAB7850169.1 hypothetical protein FRZ00_06110 [Streptomyces mobaraensis]
MTRSPRIIAEERRIKIAVTDVPDLPNDYGPTIAPSTVEITYWWRHPEHREDWRVPGAFMVSVSGPRRLKSGGVGQAEITRELWNDRRPEWVKELVAAHLPEGWDR